MENAEELEELYGADKRSSEKRTDIFILVITCLVTGFLVKLPQLFDINLADHIFYKKNTLMIIFMGLSAYSLLTKHRVTLKELIVSIVLFVVSAIYINLLPAVNDSHSINLVYIHMPLFLWCLYGVIYTDFDTKNLSKRIDFIKYNGDMAILASIILIAGGILSGVTIGLFEAIDVDVKRFYSDYIVILGVVSSPLVATYIVKKYPLIANKIAPVIASIFSPLVLFTLIVYLSTIVVTGKDPYNDRDFLLVFNFMLLGVMAIIVFSVSEISLNNKQRFSEITLFLLSVVTLIINLVALSAILYRLGEYGFTPNRTAVLGSNLLIFANLTLIMIDLYKVSFRGKAIKSVEMTFARYLPFYMIWTIFVTFALPFIFGMR